jgi:hypothetical protein
MERHNPYQLELFSAEGAKGELKPRSHNSSFLSQIRVYEKTLLIIIGIVITGVVSFSFGVETGKRTVLRQGTANFDFARDNEAQAIKQAKASPVAQAAVVSPRASSVSPALPVKPATLPVENKATITAPAVKTNLENNYTIQVASYKSKSYALKEAEKLKKQGFVTLTLVKGNYIVLCVGNFNSKESAQSFVTQLKKRYQGCTIRRL